MNTFLLRSSSERIHINDAAKQRYCAAIRPWDFVLPISINHLPFKAMHLDISGYLCAFGWETTILNLPTKFSPLATKLFYSNLRRRRTFPNTFTTIVMDDHTRFSAQVLSCLLDIPMVGQVINEEADMWRIGFDGLSAVLELCPGFPLRFLPNGYRGDLSCAPLITRLLFNMGINLYGLEMTYPQFVTTSADVFRAIDLSPPNSPDVSSGGEDKSAAEDVNPADVSLADANHNESAAEDVNHADVLLIDANPDVNPADVPLAVVNPVNATVNINC
ncbi:hypothetical protein LINGRAHAP2_LOCUS24177 [Linum grandiflorum]